MTHLRLETLELSNVGRRGLDWGSRGAHKMEKRTKEDVEEEKGCNDLDPRELGNLDERWYVKDLLGGHAHAHLDLKRAG